MPKQSAYGGKYTAILGKFEKNLVEKVVPVLPSWLGTVQLTLLTVLWSALVLLFAYLARDNVNWLWAVSLMILFQNVTDILDGAVGRHRKAGLVNWGYHMDHFLDYVFLSSLLIGYAFLVPDSALLILILFAILAGLLVNVFLAWGSLREFRSSYFKIGPTELRLALIAINTALIIFGVSYLELLLPYAAVIAAVFLISIVYHTQKKVRETDKKS